jgi:hypothetical protein
MAQKIKVQDGNIVYSNTDPTQPVNMTVLGDTNVTNQLIVGSVNTPADGVISSGDGHPASGLDPAYYSRLDIIAGNYGTLNLSQSSFDNSAITINNVQWPTGIIQPIPGMFVGVSSLNTLEYLPFIYDTNPNDELNQTDLNLLYPDILPGQSVVGPSVVYMCISAGQWRILGSATPVPPAPSLPPEYIAEIDNGFPMYAEGSYYTNWYVNVQQESADCSATVTGLDFPTVFTLTTPGSYKVTVTGRIRNTSYPEGPLPTGAMQYGIQCPGSYGNFDITTHTCGEATTSGWSNNGLQNQLQWTDTFYVMMYNVNPVNFGIGVYANKVTNDFQYNVACLVSVVRTSGTPIQPI